MTGHLVPSAYWTRRHGTVPLLDAELQAELPLLLARCQVDGDAVVLEPVVGHGAQFSCVVLDTPRGPVALPPTEIAAYDLEHDVLEAHLDMERRQARFEVSEEPKYGYVIVGCVTTACARGLGCCGGAIACQLLGVSWPYLAGRG